MVSLKNSLNSDESQINPSRLHRKLGVFLVINVLVLLVVISAMLSNPNAQTGNAVYIVVLTMICTIPLIFVSSYGGKQALLIVFLAYYFGTFALKDVLEMLSVVPPTRQGSHDFISGGEVAILVGVICFLVGHAIISKLFSDRDTLLLARDWSPNWRLILGILFWTVGYIITIRWQFSEGDVYSGVTVANPFAGFLITLRILQTLGTLILIYHALTAKSRTAMAIFILTVAADFFLGFVGDSKELAMRDLLLYLFSVVLLRERLPILQTLAFVLIAGISFNLFGAYRSAVQLKHESRANALQNLDSHINAISNSNSSLGQRLTDGLDYFADRISLKSSVEQIIARTGNDVAFQNGHTIEPLLYAFIPRFIWPDKPNSSMAGQVFNQEFKISESKNTYIATSQLGELYWNFGWTGLVIGMVLIGAFMAAIASAMKFDVLQTLPRFLFILMTIYLLCLRSETALAEVYAVWARSALLLMLLNAVVPKVPWLARNKHKQPQSRPGNVRLAKKVLLSEKPS